MKSLILFLAMIVSFAARSENGHAPINGIKMYYEVHGKKDGTPLVLLHGGGSTIESSFGRILPELAKKHWIVAVEEQGHGRTTDRQGPVRFEQSADDVAALLKHLKIKKADLFGFSNGASVALQVAIRHPKLVRKLIFASSLTKRAGTDPQFWEWIQKGGFEIMPQQLKDDFLKVNPDPAKLRSMAEKDRQRMVDFKDVPDQDVKSVQAETLIISGDRDVPTLDHLVELTKLFKNSRLIVLPGGHGDYLGEVIAPQNPRMFAITADLVSDFLASEKKP